MGLLRHMHVNRDFCESYRNGVLNMKEKLVFGQAELGDESVVDSFFFIFA